jgi:hypothetical protein
MKDNQFKLCKEHILLLQNMYWEYSDCETGAPAVNCKRPYGNSYVPPDVAKILGVTLPDEDDDDGDEEYDKKVAEIMRFHYESHIALDIILQLKTFELGTYKNIAPDKYSKPKWKKVK